MRVAPLLALLLLSSACVTPHYAGRCLDELNHCIAACPEGTPRSQQNVEAQAWTDARSQCEQRCTEAANRCQKNEKAAAVEVVKSPLAP